MIGLLSSSCTESQRESALLLGQFATTDHEFKAKIVQRGAVPPLITMLGSSDVQLKEMAAFALGRLAQNVDNQAGIVQVLLQANVVAGTGLLMLVSNVCELISYSPGARNMCS